MDLLHTWPPDAEVYPHLAAYTGPLKPAERKIVGREQEISQVLSGLSRPELCNVLLLAPAGSGKALPDDTLIPVCDPRGYVQIRDIRPGDFVFGADGKPVQVLDVYPQGKKLLYEVRFVDGRNMPCCGEHLWAVHTAGSDDPFFELNTEELLKREDLQTLAIPWNQALEREEGDLSSVDFYQIGELWSRSLESFSWAEGKRLLAGSIRQRKDLLLGLCGDVSWHSSGCSLVVTHRVLACFVKVLTHSLGLDCRVVPKGKGTGCWWQVSITSGMPDLAIDQILDLDVSVSMTCIRVDSEEGLYQAGMDCVVTHNTALVQGTMLVDKDRLYLEVDLAKMISDLSTPNEMAARLKSLFDEAEAFRKEQGQDLVLFIDEFHQIVQLSAAAVEALKPLLAASGTRGIRVIAATTFDEFQQYIQSNQALVERLCRINVREPDRNTVVSILRGMVNRYGAGHLLADDHLLECIYDYTNRYIPANSQPRKSIQVLDAMLGWYRAHGRKLDMNLLADVLYDSEGVNVAFSVDGGRIKEYLNNRVLSQTAAVDAIENRLQIAVAGMNNPTKPMSSLLFCGSTGTGKQLPDDVKVPVFDGSGGIHWKYNGDLRVGDYVFNRYGKPVEVLGVFPQGVHEEYELELTDGRKLSCGDGHLWAYQDSACFVPDGWKVDDTVSLMEQMSLCESASSQCGRFVIPMNQAVAYPELDYYFDPYSMGMLIGSGLSDGVALSALSEEGLLCDTESTFIPDLYKHGSIPQRWKLIQGLFDAGGMVGTGYNGLFYQSASLKLILDLQDLLYSLGISSTVFDRDAVDTHSEEPCLLYVNISGLDRARFFTDSEKLKPILDDAKIPAVGSPGHVSLNLDPRSWTGCGGSVGIRRIYKTGRMCSMTCIFVDDPEHLYQAGPYVVTHNTELAKGLTDILFHDIRSLHRMDMSEFSDPDSVDRFRETLCDKVWQRPYSVVLLDEVEKACGEVTRLLLQVLDDARLTNRLGREVSFVNCYIVITTNAGAEIFKNVSQYNVDDTGSGKKMMEYMRLIKDSLTSVGGSKFPPELLGRIDAVVPFQPLSEATMLAIVRRKLKEAADDMWRKHGVAVYIDKQVAEYLVREGRNTDSDAGGARAVAQRMDTEVVSAMSRYVNTHPDDRKLQVSVAGTPAYLDKSLRVSDAHITVGRLKFKPSNPVSAETKPGASRSNVIRQFRDGRL